MKMWYTFVFFVNIPLVLLLHVSMVDVPYWVKKSISDEVYETKSITVPLASKLKECFNTQKLFYENIDVLHNRIFHKHQEILLLNIDLFKHQFLIDIMKEMNSPSGNIIRIRITEKNIGPSAICL